VRSEKPTESVNISEGADDEELHKEPVKQGQAIEQN